MKEVKTLKRKQNMSMVDNGMVEIYNVDGKMGDLKLYIHECGEISVYFSDYEEPWFSGVIDQKDIEIIQGLVKNNTKDVEIPASPMREVKANHKHSSFHIECAYCQVGAYVTEENAPRYFTRIVSGSGEFESFVVYVCPMCKRSMRVIL